MKYYLIYYSFNLKSFLQSLDTWSFKKIGSFLQKSTYVIRGFLFLPLKKGIVLFFFCNASFYSPGTHTMYIF